MFKSGFISIIGKINVGKSSLLNNLIEKKISIISPKPNTTLSQIMGVYNEEKYQLIFFDNPGIYCKKDFFFTKNNSLSFKNIQNSDVILFMVDRKYQEEDDIILNILKKYNKKIFLIINKIDFFKNNTFIDKIILSYLNHFDFDEIIPLSCFTKKNLNILKEKIVYYLEEGPLYFSENIYTNIDEKRLISDFIREKILFYSDKEVPYCCKILIENIFFNKKNNLVEISSLILVQKTSQRKIIIGKKGYKIKKIISESKKDIRKIFNMNICLNLYVKISSSMN
ncbi:GTPase Era [Candidatus Phytoplasma sacchari]|nr:GTPase Era [Candidatus Phytoplasma sacchari]